MSRREAYEHKGWELLEEWVEENTSFSAWFHPNYGTQIAVD